MTDKKLLEEFREFVDFMYESIDLEDHQRFIAISESMLKDGWFKWIYKLAKEQAERVQEMENEMKRIKIKYRATKESHYSYSEITSQLEQQNKRYREALEEILDARNHFYATEYVFGVEGIARQALEGEE